MYQPIHCSALFMPQAIDYQTCSPPADLADFVIDFWQMFIRPGTGLVPAHLYPATNARLRFIASSDHVEAFLYGPSTSPHRKGIYFEGQNSFGVTITADHSYHLFGVPASEYENTRIDLEVFWPEQVKSLKQRLCGQKFKERVSILSDFLRDIINIQASPSADFRNAYRLLLSSSGTIEISELSQYLHISSRTLRRRFQQYIGMGPKHAARVVRLQSWMRRSFVAGLYDGKNDGKNEMKRAKGMDDFPQSCSDQSHWIREFKSMIGTTPVQFKNQLSNLSDISLPCWKSLSLEHYKQGYKKIVKFPR